MMGSRNDTTIEEAPIGNVHDYKHQAQAHNRFHSPRPISSSGQPPRHLDFPMRPDRQTPRHTNQGGSSKHARHFLFSFSSRGRFPELTPVRSQTTEPWFATLEAGDITLPLEWMSTFTRESRGGEGSRSHLESGNERQGTWSPLVVD